MKYTEQELTAKLQNDLQFVLQWIKKSIDANNGKGSSAFFSRYRHPLRGWSPAYPETTGYLIPTLYNYADFLKDESLREYAYKCGDWLTTIQRSDGGYPSNYADNPNYSIFNTGQILFGLLRSYEETKLPKYVIACERAYGRLLQSLEGDFRESGNYVPGYIPAYYTRVIWPMLLVSQKLGFPGAKRLKEELSHFSELITEDFTVRNWSFFPGKPAFTHTVAYTIRGFLECAVLTENEALLEQTSEIYKKTLQFRLQDCKTAGSITELPSTSDYSYTCVTGNLQLAIIGFRLSGLLVEKKTFYRNTAISFLGEGAASIPHRDPLTYSYALPGSVPLWGKYMRGKYPNWVAKFYLDAVLQYIKTENS